jgi:hypothetical protein
MNRSYRSPAYAWGVNEHRNSEAGQNRHHEGPQDEGPHDEDAASTRIGVGVAIGAGAGAALFAATGSPVWIGVGVAIGVALGAAADRR